jgi:hypothetical protein
MTNIIFSVGPVEGKRSVMGDHGFPLVSQSEVAIEGRVRVVAPADGFFGNGRSYRGPVLENPTWRAIRGQAGKAAKRTGDLHHVFLEGIHVTGTENDELGPVKIIGLVMGS